MEQTQTAKKTFAFPYITPILIGVIILTSFVMFGSFLATQITYDRKSKTFESIVSSSPDGQAKSLSFEGISTTIDKTGTSVRIALHDFPASQCMLIRNMQHHIIFHHQTAVLTPPTSMVGIVSNPVKGSSSVRYKCESDHNDAQISYAKPAK